MTRQLNATGYPTLRMDLSTIGDSGASGQALSRLDQLRIDVNDAMDLLAIHAGCSRFVLIGLCTGAANSHAVAVNDARVAGVVFLDAFVYRTFGYRLRHYLPRLLSGRLWMRYARARPKEVAQRDMKFEATDPPREAVRANYAHMLARGLKLCFIYSGGISSYFNATRQFGEMFGKIAKSPGVTVRYFAHTDHTYALVGDRQLVLDTINAWLDDTFPIQST
jgi:hypothetical protein